MIGTTIGVSLYWLLAVVLLGAYFIYSAVMEERFMAGRFPDSYPEYRRSAKMLIPGSPRLLWRPLLAGCD
jgi:protein-S-isoprenylcysteine O-methyltransferase Ste14